MIIRRTLRFAVSAAALTLLAALIAGPAPAASAAGPVRTLTDCTNDSATDYDFRHQGRDVAIGVPGEDIGTHRDAGSVEVRYGCDTLAPQGLQLPHPKTGDKFGAALAGGYYSQNYDVIEALFVGVPDLDVHGHKDAGGVAEFRGSTTGLHFHKLWTQDTAGVPGRAQSGAHFGAALSLVDTNEESFTLYVGEPGKDVGRARNTGGYVALNWNEDPEAREPNYEVTVASLGFHAQNGDLFGSSFSTVGVGAPGRTVHGHAGAGAVFEEDQLDKNPWSLVTQDTPGVAGSPETGDHFGATLAGSWIGVPGESIGGATHAGIIQSYDPNNTPVSMTLDQNTAGVPGEVGTNHRFGTALALQLDDFIETGPSDYDTLFVGAPGDAAGAGSVSALRLVAGASGDDPGFTGDAAAVPNVLPAGSHFGATVAASGDHGLVVGAPDSGGGHVTTFVSPLGFTGFPTEEASWVQTAGTPEAGDAYGGALAPPESYGDF